MSESTLAHAAEFLEEILESCWRHDPSTEAAWNKATSEAHLLVSYSEGWRLELADTALRVDTIIQALPEDFPGRLMSRAKDRFTNHWKCSGPLTIDFICDDTLSRYLPDRYQKHCRQPSEARPFDKAGGYSMRRVSFSLTKSDDE